MLVIPRDQKVNKTLSLVLLLILSSSCDSFPCSYGKLVLNQDSSFFLISWNILITCLLNGYVNHFWEFMGKSGRG